MAGILAIFLGGIGIHKFYLGKAEWGLIYFFFSWTGIPLLLGIFEGFIYLTMSQCLIRIFKHIIHSFKLYLDVV